MHYANGQEAKLGDLVVLRKKSEYKQGTEYLGNLVQAPAGSTACNGMIQPIAQRFVSDLGVTGWLLVPAYPTSVTIGELMPVEFADPTVSTSQKP